MEFIQNDIFSELYPKFTITKPIRLIELFAGIGSQAKALKNLGANFEHWKAVEFDKYAMASYNAIHGTHFEVSDIRNVHAADLDLRERERYCYIMTYSFPCQDLSIAGKMKGMKKGSNTRSGLLWEVERILDECNGNLPQVLLMENVQQVISKRNIEDFYDWRYKLESLGYQNYVDLLNAKDYGIPQNRMRCFMVSLLGNFSYEFPKPVELGTVMKDFLDDKVDEKYYLSERGGGTLPTQKDWTRSTRKSTILDVKYIGIEDEPRVYSNIIPTLSARDYKDPLRVAEPIGEDMRIRKLTPKECWRLMGFTDEDFEKAQAVNSDTQLYKQAGNSIVVQVLEAIFAQMLP